MVAVSLFGVAVIIFAIVSWLRKKSTANSSLESLPLLKFDKNDTRERYISETRSLMKYGYQKLLKKGKAFRIRNPVDEQKPLVILPLSYIDEVKNAPQNHLSFPLFSEQAFLLRYTGGPIQTDPAAAVVRLDMTRNLGNLLDDMHQECISAIETKMPQCKDWTSLRPYEVIPYLVARITGVVLVGSDLGRSEEWVKLMIETTMIAHMAAQTVRAAYSPRWRWLAPWFHPAAKQVFANRRRATQLLLPTYKERVGKHGEAKKPNDGIQWLINAWKGQNRTVEQFADEQLFISVASIHTTATTTLHLLFDILAHPEYVDDLIQEIKQVQAEDSKWTKLSIAKLKKLDSFMKESQRLNPVGYITMQRATVKPFTFKDGLQIPAGTHLSMPSYELNLDADIYPDPQRFDPWRSLRLREAGDVTKFQFANVSDDSINFGAGSHACPGRFFASNEIKLMVVELLLRYEMRFPVVGTERPPNMIADFQLIPNMAAEILVKERGGR